MPHIRYRLLLVLALSAIAVLNGCATRPPAPPAELSETDLIANATKAEQLGNYEHAARYYLQLADRASELKRPEYQLQATMALVKGNFVERAKRVLVNIDVEKLHVMQMIRRQLLVARIALAENDAASALETLNIDAGPTAPLDLQLQLHELRAQAYYRLGNLLESARERVFKDALLEDPDAVLQNQQIIWQTLMLLSEVALDQLRVQPPPDVFSGWMTLALLAKQAASQTFPAELALQQWQTEYPRHPAREEIIASITIRQRNIIEKPAQIALLLPLSGPVAGPATALRDGFLAAHYQRLDRSYQPQIRLYDTGGEDNAPSVYRRAILDGADIVIGPLLKSEVTQLMAETEIVVPTLALNYGEDSGRDIEGLYQFGLAPEDEARQVAERAWLDGHNRALIIVPEGDWGQRIAQAFASEWQAFGGTIAEQQIYPADINDFSPQLQALLDLDTSKQRLQSLRELLRQDLKFEPRRRQDADFVFMAAFPRQARLIRPQLRFHYAADLPVYSTSHIYSGVRDRGADRDMDDVIFCDIPWVLSQQRAEDPLKSTITRLWPLAAESYTRFFAFGIDAYNIIPHLPNLRTFSYERYSGYTGLLQLTDHNHIFRKLAWARFENGIPKPY